jgi:integrase
VNTTARSGKAAAATTSATELHGTIDQFLKEKEEQRSPRTGEKLSFASLNQYRVILTTIWEPWFKAQTGKGGRDVDQTLDAFTDSLQAAGRRRDGKELSLQTIRTYVKVVRVYLRWAEAPSVRYVAIRAKKKKLDTLTRDEIDAMERAARTERDRLLVRVLADTGIRVGELVTLTAGSLHEDRRGRLWWIEVDGKTGLRTVPMPRETWRRLKAYADSNPGDEYIFMGARRRADGERERLTPGGASQMIGNLGKDAKIGKRVYSHLFRHSYATHMLNRGMNPIELQRILGHSSLEMISENYAHLKVGDLYAAMERAL